MQIKKNENSFDRFVKLLIGVMILFFTFYWQIPLIFALMLVFFALWCIITGIIGYCPLYNLLGINTLK